MPQHPLAERDRQQHGDGEAQYAPNERRERRPFGACAHQTRRLTAMIESGTAVVRAAISPSGTEPCGSASPRTTERYASVLPGSSHALETRIPAPPGACRDFVEAGRWAG